MIDIELPVFNQVRNALRTAFLQEYPNLTILNDRPEVHQKFPCVVITQDDNFPYRRTQTAEAEEQYAEVMFTVDVYTAVASGGKTLAKAIADVADAEFTSLFFSRMFIHEMPNEDRKLKRFTARYRAVVQKAKVSEGNDDTQNYSYLIFRR